MNIRLIQEPKKSLTGLEQVLSNRGIQYQDIHHWLNTTDADINDFNLLGADRLRAAATTLIKIIKENKKALVIIDADADGFCSSAILINYLYDLFPSWVSNNLDWFMHSGKQHGLSDVNIEEVSKDYSLVITPDGSSEDYEYHLAFAEKNVDIIVLDHHEAKIVSPNAIVINNQLCDYPNKFMCGAGITWQFCRYLDSLMNTKYADNYIDLVALGLVSDMMSLRPMETKHLVFKGFQPENIHNPFIAEMVKKQEYPMSKRSLPNAIAWYITPFINAMVRSGEEQEKELLFKSFLKFHAFTLVPSDKRGHKVGEQEKLIVQALRAIDRVKKRQTDAQDEAMELLESMIEEQHLLDHKVLLFLLNPGEVDRNVAGLAANKIMGKYQRPCAVLTRCENEKYVSYEGSARGCDAKGVYAFKDICAGTGFTTMTAGHQGAFGLGVKAHELDLFMEACDRALQTMPDEQIYYVDYIYRNNAVDAEQLLSITELFDVYGKDINESLVAVKNLKVTPDMVQVYIKKNNTLKITLSNSVNIMLFDAPDELCMKLQNTQGYVEMNIVGIPKANNYNGWTTAQIFIEDYEIIKESKHYF